MSKELLNKIIIYVVIGIITIGAGLGVWALVDHYSQSDNGDKLVVYTSMYPLYDFAQKIGGDKVAVYSIVPDGEEPHHYQGPSGKKLASIEDADLVILTGAGMESYHHAFSENPKIASKLVDSSVGITLLEREESHDEEEEHEEDEHDHDHSYDPHIWLSLTNARIQMENIKNALVAKDSANAAYYQRNFDIQAVMLDGLKLQYDALLQNLSTTTFIVSHRAFGYIAHEYGLTQISLTSIMSTGDVSGSSMQNAIQQINAEGLQVIFYNSAEDSQIVNQIASETGITVDHLSTIEMLSKQEKAQGYDYLSLMARNLVALYDALR